MLIIISDENRIWTPFLPALAPYASDILVVCLNGKKVTDKYRCFVSDYHEDEPAFLYGKNTKKYAALKAVSKDLLSCIGDDNDIVFLTDGEPAGLYPYLTISSCKPGKRLHLVAMAPWAFESSFKTMAWRMFLRDLSSLNSFLLFDSEKILREADRRMTLPDLLREISERCNSLLPQMLIQVQEGNWDKAYFDWHSMKYVPIEEELSLLYEPQPPEETGIDEMKDPGNVPESMVGKILPDCSAVDTRSTRKTDSMSPRVDGKKVCEYLRALRVRAAEANGIPFESEDCPSVGPCAGTCPKCDAELAYLQRELAKIPPEKRIYPKESLIQWEV